MTTLVWSLPASLLTARRRSKSLTRLAHLRDHVLRDIGMSENIRHVLRARREADLARLGRAVLHTAGLRPC